MTCRGGPRAVALSRVGEAGSQGLYLATSGRAAVTTTIICSEQQQIYLSIVASSISMTGMSSLIG